ncbi:hypothetical protein BX070DRAFT_226231 [Coemansia spiralis]|nr:hypothetical protein BX070DRAFT_226231 [Coemansia spiralis]
MEIDRSSALPQELDEIHEEDEDEEGEYDEEEPGRPPLQHPGTIPSVNVELDKIQSLEIELRNAAATSSSRGPTNLTKSSSAKSTSAANGTKKRQRSNTRDEQSNKARLPKEDIPLQALVTNSSALSTVEATAVQAISQDDAVGTGNATLNNNDTSATSGDIGSFASGIVDGVGNMDDDMGLGMGLGMGMDMGDFASSMFGITDDDFNFFDTEDPMAVFSQPDLEAASSVDVEPKSHGLDKPPINAHASAEINTAIPEQPMQDMDDLFDDGTSAPSSSAPIKQEEEPGSSENAYDIKPQVKSEVDNQLMDSSAIGMADVVSSLSVDSKATLSALSLSSPPGLTRQAAPAASATTDMATPAVDLQTPTPTAQMHASLMTTDMDSEIAYQQPSTSSYAKSALQAQRAGINPKITTTSMTPKHYSFVSTPYDDISTSSKSWLRDNLTISQEADSQETQYISLRISARRIQQHQMVSSSTPTSGPGALPSIRRLRGWLASYKAKSIELMLASGDGTHHQPSTIALGESTLATSDGHNGDGGSVTTCLSKAANSDGIKPELVSNLQYPSTGRADARDFDNSYASASLLSSDQQPQHNSGLPSFTSIINPRKSQKQVHAHMPGSLMPSLSIHDLQKAMDVSTPLNILEIIVRAKTISGFADAFINSQIAFRLAWEDSVSSLAHVVKDSLLSMSGDDVVRLMNISLAPFLFSSQILKTTGQLSQENTNTHDLGARIGSLLMLGTDRINKSKVDNAQECDPAGNSDVAKDNQTDTAADAAFNKCDWTDWAVGSCFLACRHIVTSTVNSTQEIGPALSTNSQYQDQRDNGASMDIDSVAGTSNQIDDDEAGSLAEEPLTLSKLLALESSKPSPTSKYRGFVLSGIYGNAIGSTASAHPSGSTTNISTANASGTSVVPSGPGIIEPLLDVRILDVAIPSSGGATLKSRDAESIYVKRWRRATHEAQTEEGEEKEEGEDEVPVEDWPDPDNYAMEAEDALRRVCISTSPMQMRPIGASKDVRWVSFIPPFFSLSSAPSLISDPQRSSFIGEEGDASALVREWCQSCSNVAQWYLGDVDSFYQAMHFGAHRPLGLQKTLDGTFTQLTESLLPAASNIAESLEWSARLRYEAERLGQCMAHGWYTNSQLEQQKKTQEAVEGTLMAGGGSALGSLPATTLVLYMLVPHSSHMAIWLAMSEASNITLRAFESTLGSLITRTSLGVPSSTTTVSSQVPWPAIVVHPLPLDLLSEWYCGRRPGIVPSAQETAMSVYNRCPEFLTPAPSLLTPLSASQLAGSFGTTPNPSNAGVGTNPTVAPNGNSPAHGVCEWKQEAGAFVAAVSSASDSLAAQGNTHHLGAGQLSRHSGYFAHTHDQQQVSTPGKPSSGHHFGITGFAHRAYIVSMPCTFPSHSGAFVPATMSLSRTGQRRDIVGEQLPDAHGSRSSVQRPTAAGNVAALEEDSQVASKTDDEVSCELAEVHVRFDCVQRSALSPGTATADTSNLYSKLIDHPLRPSDQIATLHCVYMVVKQKWIAICWCDERGEYVEHDVFDLRAGVQEDTQREVSALSPAVAARIWRGCLRYQRLFCGRQNQLRVVLGEWQGMAQMQALQWHAYAEAWNAYIARRQAYFCICSYVQLPSAPQQGCTVESTIPGALNSSSSEVCEKLANRHFSVVLHGQHPHLGYRCDAETLASDPNGWSTGYMVLQDHRTCTKAVPCFCVQLLDARDGDHKRSLLATRAILKQYHQLAVLRDAECNLIALDAEEFGEWPANLLPLPVAVVQDICSALEAII